MKSVSSSSDDAASSSFLFFLVSQVGGVARMSQVGGQSQLGWWSVGLELLFGFARMSQVDNDQSQTRRLGKVGRCCTLTSHAPQGQSVWWSVARLHICKSVKLVFARVSREVVRTHLARTG